MRAAGSSRTIPQQEPPVSDRTPAERLDHALDVLLADEAPPPGDPAIGPLLLTAERVRWAVAPVPAGARFQERLAVRIARAPHRPPAGRWLHPPAWLLLTGAVSSAVVGVGMTAYVLWRGNRRSALQRLTGR
jgi:hypothetical protein